MVKVNNKTKHTIITITMSILFSIYLINIISYYLYLMSLICYSISINLNLTLIITQLTSKKYLNFLVAKEFN
jgi:hypothetical protein